MRSIQKSSPITASATHLPSRVSAHAAPVVRQHPSSASAQLRPRPARPVRSRFASRNAARSMPSQRRSCTAIVSSARSSASAPPTAASPTRRPRRCGCSRQVARVHLAPRRRRSGPPRGRSRSTPRWPSRPGCAGCDGRGGRSSRSRNARSPPPPACRSPRRTSPARRPRPSGHQAAPALLPERACPSRRSGRRSRRGRGRSASARRSRLPTRPASGRARRRSGRASNSGSATSRSTWCSAPATS